MVRFKNRYLLVELVWEDGKCDAGISSYHLFRAIQEAVQVNFGDYGAGSVLQSLNVKYYDNQTQLAIVRSSRANFRAVATAIGLMKTINGGGGGGGSANRRMMMRMLHVGGTIRSCKKSALEHSQRALRAIQLEVRRGILMGKKWPTTHDDHEGGGGDDGDDGGFAKVQKTILALRP